jgi:acetyl esterase/lipase
MQAEKGCIKLVIEMYPLIDAGPVPDAWSYDLYPVLESQRDEAMSRVSRFLAPSDSLAETYTRGNRSTLLDPLISVIYCDDLSVFPRTVVVTADYDYLRYQGELFAKRLFDSGVSVRAIRYAGCDHGFFETCGVMPQVEDLCHIFAEELGKL